MTQLEISIITVILTALATGFFTYHFGFKRYLKEKRSERIRRTYIDGGIGNIIDGIEQVSGACYLNYAKIIWIFDLLENSIDNPEEIKETIDKIFQEMEDSKSVPSYGDIKLSIFNNQPLILLVVKMRTELQRLSENMRHAGKKNVQEYFKGQQTRSDDEKRNFLAEQKKIIRNEWKSITSKYEHLKGSLLLLQIETDKIDILSIDDIDNIERQEGVTKILNSIEKQYSNDIKNIDRKFTNNENTEIKKL